MRFTGIKLNEMALLTSSFLLLLLFSVPASSASTDNNSIILNFGVYSSNKPTAMVRTFKPTLKALEKSMTSILKREVKIRMQIAKDYNEGVSALINGKVDFSRFGPASYIQAKKENTGLELLAMESKAKSKVFYGTIVVHKDSKITDIRDLKGHSFAFGDESSTIGRYLSQLYLVDNDIRAGDLSYYKYLGRHDKVGTAVGAGDFYAGALNESTFKKLVAGGEPIRELARFPNVTKPWIARQGLDRDVFSALQASLYQLKDTKALKSLKADGFLAGSDEDYQRIRTSMEFNERFFQEREKSKESKSAAVTHSVNQTVQGVTLNNAIPSNIQINIFFEKTDSESISDYGPLQPIIVNVTIPKDMPSSEKPVITTSNMSEK